MGLIQRIIDASQRNRRIEAQKITQEFRNALFSSPLCSDYENVFAQVRPLIDEMVLVKPYGVGRNGAELDKSRTPELNLIYEPNYDMGGVEFMDTMFATWLTENALYIRVHKKGNKVAGYTLLPPNSKVNLGNGEYYWQIQTSDGMERVYPDEVMQLHYSRNPRDLKGVSPASAIRVYAQIDDLLAQFEKAYLENGAIPASVSIIRASTEAKYNEVRHELESQLSGARNRNKTLYLWRQFNNDDGSEKDQVEVKTIQGNNNTLAIRELVDVVNDRLNKAYGVSNFILGDDASAKYDNAELSDYQFKRRRVLPALVKFWSQFQHELDRITGGLGYAIQFKLDLPELTERKKIEAETNAKNADSLEKMIRAGARPADACIALGLKFDRWHDSAVGIWNRVLIDRQLERQTMEQTQNNSLPRKIDTSPSCGCQHHHSEDAYQPFTDDEKVEKKIFDKLVKIAEAIFAEDASIDMEQIKEEIYKLIKDEANRGGIDALESLEKLVDEETKEAIEELLKSGGDKVSEELQRRLKERTDLIVNNYAEHTHNVMRSVLQAEEPLSAGEIKKRLAEVLPKGRAATIARNETVYAFKSGGLEMDERIAKEHNLKVELTWHARHDSITCNVCSAMDGQKTMLGDKYANSVTLKQGTRLINGKIVGEAPEGASEEEKKEYTGDLTFGYTQDQWNDDGTIPNAHVNCRCFYTKRIVKDGE